MFVVRGIRCVRVKRESAAHTLACVCLFTVEWPWHADASWPAHLHSCQVLVLHSVCPQLSRQLLMLCSTTANKQRRCDKDTLVCNTKAHCILEEGFVGFVKIAIVHELDALCNQCLCLLYTCNAHIHKSTTRHFSRVMLSTGNCVTTT